MKCDISWSNPTVQRSPCAFYITGENACTYGGTRTPWHTQKTGLSHGLPYATRVYKYCWTRTNCCTVVTGSVHNGCNVCSRLAIFGKNHFLLFVAYSASVERWLVRDLVLALRSLPCVDVVNYINPNLTFRDFLWSCDVHFSIDLL